MTNKSKDLFFLIIQAQILMVQAEKGTAFRTDASKETVIHLNYLALYLPI